MKFKISGKIWLNCNIIGYNQFEAQEKPIHVVSFTMLPDVEYFQEMAYMTCPYTGCV